MQGLTSPSRCSTVSSWSCLGAKGRAIPLPRTLYVQMDNFSRRTKICQIKWMVIRFCDPFSCLNKMIFERLARVPLPSKLQYKSSTEIRSTIFRDFQSYTTRSKACLPLVSKSTISMRASHTVHVRSSVDTAECRSRSTFRRFFLGNFHLLVYPGVFDVVELLFGLIGHTHDGEEQGKRFAVMPEVITCRGNCIRAVC